MTKPDAKLSLTQNAKTVLAKRYLKKNEKGEAIEEPEDMFRRVAENIAQADRLYIKETKEANSKTVEEFYNAMTSFEFLPNSPTLMNAGRELQMLSACFVLPLEDSMEGIFETLKHTSMIHKAGGGCIAKGSKVFTTFCGLENIDVLYERVKQDGNKELRDKLNNCHYIDILSKNINTLSFNNNGKFQKDKIERLWRYKLQPENIYGIKAEGGLEVTTSCWHPFFVFENGSIVERRADELKKGDWLVGPNSTTQQAWLFKDYQKIGNIKIDEKIGWLLGYFLGDGSIGKYLNKTRIRFFDESVETLEKVIEILKEVCGVKYSMQKDTRNKTRYLAIYNRTIIDLIKTATNLYGAKDSKIEMPTVILKSPLSVLRSFMAGLIDSDGYVHKDKLKISYATASYNMAQELISLFYLLGYKASIRKRYPRKSHWAVMYEVSVEGGEQIRRLWAEIGEHLVSKFRRERFKKYAKHESHTSSTCPLKFKHIQPYLEEFGVKTRCSKIHRESLKVGSKMFWLARWKWEQGVCLSKVKDLLCEMLKHKQKLSVSTIKRLEQWTEVLPTLRRITDIKTNIKSEDFYDFTVAKNNNYLAGINGMTVIHNTGFSFSKLRPKGSMVKSTTGIASGPISFLKVFDSATEAVKQGGVRRGASMGILQIDHPDILEFIKCKEDDKSITNFNISVTVTEDFMEKVKRGEDYNLIEPHSKEPVGKLNAKEVFDLIVKQAHKNGEPGIIFIDRMNKDNPTPKIGAIESTNPCGEQPILPYESCNLGSINLSKILIEKNEKKGIDWNKLAKITHTAVHFLDNVIDMNKYPLKEIEEMTKSNRKIGLGVMGWADMLIQLGVSYNSDEAVKLAEKVMKFVVDEAGKKTKDLAVEKGEFPNFKDSIFSNGKKIRNATLTTIAPTGTLSIIAGCSGGIEPLFAICYYRKVLDGAKLIEVNPHFERIARERGFYSEELMKKISQQSSIQDMEEIPEDVRRIFVTSHDISPEWHIKTQAAFQSYTDNAVSKTVNFSYDATPDDVEKVYMLAYKLGCKGVTIYRDGSREEQVLNIDKSAKTTEAQVEAKEGNKEAIEKQEVKEKLDKVIEEIQPGNEKIAPRPRPKVVHGTTTKVQTGCGNLYVTINEDELGRPLKFLRKWARQAGALPVSWKPLAGLFLWGFAVDWTFVLS